MPILWQKYPRAASANRMVIMNYCLLANANANFASQALWTRPQLLHACVQNTCFTFGENRPHKVPIWAQMQMTLEQLLCSSIDTDITINLFQVAQYKTGWNARICLWLYSSLSYCRTFLERLKSEILFIAEIDFHPSVAFKSFCCHLQQKSHDKLHAGSS